MQECKKIVYYVDHILSIIIIIISDDKQMSLTWTHMRLDFHSFKSNENKSEQKKFTLQSLYRLFLFI